MSGCSRKRREVLRPGGAVVVEIGASQASRIGVAAADAGFGSVEVETDLTGRDRIVDGAEAHIAWIPSPTPSPPFARAG